jgi:hypothetical protein
MATKATASQWRLFPQSFAFAQPGPNFAYISAAARHTPLPLSARWINQNSAHIVNNSSIGGRDSRGAKKISTTAVQISANVSPVCQRQHYAIAMFWTLLIISCVS